VSSAEENFPSTETLCVSAENTQLRNLPLFTQVPPPARLAKVAFLRIPEQPFGYGNKFMENDYENAQG
jgi:hypothetical protein